MDVINTIFDNFVKIGVVIILIAVVAAPFTFSWLHTLPDANQTYDVVVTVQAVERSTKFGDHTNVWVQVYGDQDITYTLIDFHDFTVGEKYHLVFKNEQYLIWWGLWWFETRGAVQTLEMVK